MRTSVKEVYSCTLRNMKKWWPGSVLGSMKNSRLILIMSEMKSGKISHVYFALSAKRWRKHSVRTLSIPEWSVDTMRRENSDWYLSQRRNNTRNRMKMTAGAYIFVTPKAHHDVRSEEFDESLVAFLKSSSWHPWTWKAHPTCS